MASVFMDMNPGPLPKLRKSISSCFDIWCFRKMLKILLIDKFTCEKLIRRANARRTLLNLKKKQQLKFMRHIFSEGELKNLILTGKIDGKRARGEQRSKMLENTVRGSREDILSNPIIKTTYDRNSWRAMIANVCTRDDTL